MANLNDIRSRYNYLQYLGLSLVLLVTGCRTGMDGSDSEERSENELLPLESTEPVKRDLAEIKESGVLRMITHYSSSTWFLHEGMEAGFEYELVRAFADDHGLTLEVIIPGKEESPWELLNAGEGDLVAANLIITPELEEQVRFTNPYDLVDQILVTRSDLEPVPENLEELVSSGMTVTVQQGSSHHYTLRHLASEGYPFRIETVSAVDSEMLLFSVIGTGKESTVANSNMLSAARRYMQGLRRGPVLSEANPVAWAVRKNATELADELNHYLGEHFRFDEGDPQPKRSEFLNVLRQRYFVGSSVIAEYYNPEWAFDSPDLISPFDGEIQHVADSLGLDWLMLSAMIAQESRFEPSTKSWAGAVGLMQIIPRFSEVPYPDLYDPAINIREGASIIRQHLDHYAYLDSLNQWSFALATYNAGKGHIADARRLTIDRNKDPNTWEHVAESLLMLMESPWYENARYGYTRGIETVNYVEKVLNRYRTYEQVMVIAELRGGTRMPAMEAIIINGL